MSQTSLSRIPFRVRDELMILSMSRWMRFVGAIKVVAGLVTVFLLLVGFIAVGALMHGAPMPESVKATVTVKADGPARQVSTERVRELMHENHEAFLALGVFALLMSVASTVLGFVLYSAAEDFDRVARSDVADQDFIAEGIGQLVLYFRWSILLGVATVLVAITAAIGLAARFANVS